MLRSAVRHGDVMVLAGNKVPDNFSRRKVEALNRANYLDHGD